MDRVELDLPLAFVAGGVFVAGCTLPLLAECELVVHTADEDIVCAARVVFANETGAGLELVGVPPEILERLTRLAEPEPEPDETKKLARNIHERLRGLTLVQQIKLASHGEVTERMVLERIYGKTVWEPILRNPRVTAPEVARIARMGALPKPMLELICTNGNWLQLPEVRRALLAHPRLAPDQILRVLRMLPKHELKLAATQTSYSQAVRTAAKRLIREQEQ